jgi:mRNA-degrading endonuclease RelE of RelBE toxin-antitoxin system
MTIRVQPIFKRDLKQLTKKYPHIVDDYADFLETLQKNPIEGESLGKDCYKVRMAISDKNKGKSGGARVITCVKIKDDVIHLLALYDKSEKETISNKELQLLLKQIK